MRFSGEWSRRLLLITGVALVGPTGLSGSAHAIRVAPRPAAPPKPFRQKMAERKQIRTANHAEKKKLGSEISGLKKQNATLGKQNQAFGQEKAKLAKENLQLSKEKGKLEQQKGKLEDRKAQAEKKLSAAQASRTDAGIRRDDARNPVSKAYYQSQVKRQGAQVQKAQGKVDGLENKIGDKQAAIRSKENDIGARSRAAERIGLQQQKNNFQIGNNQSVIRSKQSDLSQIRRDPSRSLQPKADPNQKAQTVPLMGSRSSSAAQAKLPAPPPLQPPQAAKSAAQLPPGAPPSLSTPANVGAQNQVAQKATPRAQDNPPLPPPRDDGPELWKGVQRADVPNQKRPLPPKPEVSSAQASSDGSPPSTPPLKRQRTEAAAVPPAPPPPPVAASAQASLAGKGNPPPSLDSGGVTPPPAPPPPPGPGSGQALPQSPLAGVMGNRRAALGEEVQEAKPIDSAKLKPQSRSSQDQSAEAASSSSPPPASPQRGALLDEIRKGRPLKKAEDRKLGEAKQPATSAEKGQQARDAEYKRRAEIKQKEQDSKSSSSDTTEDDWK